jgi:hypothetical protein
LIFGIQFDDLVASRFDGDRCRFGSLDFDCFLSSFFSSTLSRRRESFPAWTGFPVTQKITQLIEMAIKKSRAIDDMTGLRAIACVSDGSTYSHVMCQTPTKSVQEMQLRLLLVFCAGMLRAS